MKNLEKERINKSKISNENSLKQKFKEIKIGDYNKNLYSIKINKYNDSNFSKIILKNIKMSE